MARKAARKKGDRTVQFLAGAIFVTVLVALTAVLYLVASGLMKPHAPRTIVERQIQFAESTLEKTPGSAQAWTDLIDAYNYSSQYSDAKRAFNNGLKSVTESESPAPLYVAYARTLAHKKDFDEAIKVADKAIKVAETWRKKYIAGLAEKGVTKTSINAQRTGQGPIIDALMVKAAVYRERKEWSKVVDMMNQTIKMAPMAADHLTLRGIAQLELGNEKKARADFEQAAEYGFEPAKAELKKLEK